MDRTAWIVVISCLAIIGVIEFQQYKDFQHAAQVAAANPHVPATPPANAPSGVPTLSPANPAQTPPNYSFPKDLPEATTTQLENQFIRVTFTTNGGAIQDVELLKHKVDESRNVILNYQQPQPLLNLIGWDGEDLLVPYQIEPDRSTTSSITYVRHLSNGLTVERTYELHGDYQISLKQTFTNPNGTPITVSPYQLNVGVAEGIYPKDSSNSLFSAWLTADGSNYKKFGVGSFEAPGIFFYKWGEPRSVIHSDPGNLSWVAVKNQFFTVILTAPPEDPITRASAIRIDLPKVADTGVIPHGIQTLASFAGVTVPALGSTVSQVDLYAGPKEYEQLKTLKPDQDKILEFAVWGLGFMIPIVEGLLTTMIHVHRGFNGLGWHWDLNYGWVVIIVTLLIKGLLWPLQSAANRSMKAMQVLQPRIKELQERYKDDPQKMQTELMKIYKDYGVNPMGGCLPMLVQLPILLSFYTMLQSAVELRHVSWLWIRDLSQPDTVGHFLGQDINILPLFMTATQWVLMKMTPSSQDNEQMKIMQWMPFIMLPLFYSFPSALSLYWTVGNLVSIIQTYRNLKKPLPKLERKKKPRTNPFGKK